MKFLQIIDTAQSAAFTGLGMGIAVKFFPQIDLLLFLGVAILLDCASAWIRARKLNAVSASKLIETGYKMAIYSIIITSVQIMINTLAKTHEHPQFNYGIITNVTISLFIFIEIYSSFKHIQKAFPSTPFTKYVVTPFIHFLEGRLNKNPIKKNLES